MKLCVLKENPAVETRVAATPETVGKFVQLGFTVAVVKGAGEGAAIADDDFRGAGAAIAGHAAEAMRDADVVLAVRAPEGDFAGCKKGALLIGLLAPHADAGIVKRSAAAGLTAMAMEFMPRISRAQYMDVLSSQANLAGYKAVVDAVAFFHRAVPMMMTAAGTIAPARVFVMGAGVAGLQAIATARRLGAIVSATDVRAAAAEQVQSLGAAFIMVERDGADAETAAGYAREMGGDYKRAQAQLIAGHIRNQDIVVCTALIPGRPAPLLVSEEMVKSMRPGSVVVDLAVEQGGNCPLSRPGEIVTAHGVAIMGHANVPGRLAVDASAMLAKNLYNFVATLVDAGQGGLSVDYDDELVRGVTLTRAGKIIHPQLLEARDD